jgi:hypothetical protein
LAELTNLESKLGEVLGLAGAAKGLTQKVKALAEDVSVAEALQRMHDEAAETESRCEELAGSFDGKKTAILEKGRETKQEATEMAETYLGDDADVLDGFEFMTMAEAGEVGHWEIVEVMAKRAGFTELQELAAWALPIQRRHFEQARETALALAAEEDPNEEE